MNLANTERAQLCDLLDRVGPDAPTLCEGWSTHDLAAHLWVREADPLATPGIAIPALAGVTAARMAAAKRRWSYPELVRRLRGGPPRASLFAIPAVNEAANGAEYFVHHEDVRRAGPEPAPPRPLGADAGAAFWSHLRLLGRAMFRGAGVGVVLEREADGETIRVAPGDRIVTIVGEPGELLLYAFGRRDRAVVRFVGEPDAVAALHGAAG